MKNLRLLTFAFAACLWWGFVAASTRLSEASSGSGAGEAATTFRDCDSCPEMVVIPGGTYRMGDLSDLGLPAEKPVHKVTVQAFALGKFEISFAQYDACVDAGVCTHRPDDERLGRGTLPVMNVSVSGVEEYLRYLSDLAGHEYRLPSEAEWEYAARAGTETPFYWGVKPSTEQANFNGLRPFYGAEKGGYRRRTASVGSYPPNAFGLHDMLGNVFEWVADCWNTSYEGAPGDGSAWTEGECERRVARGGSWHHIATDNRAAYRGRYVVRMRAAGLGFRVARDTGKEEELGADKDQKQRGEDSE